MKTPEGEILYSLRPFTIKKDGTETVTQQRLVFSKPDKQLLVQLSKLLGAIHKDLK